MSLLPCDEPSYSTNDNQGSVEMVIVPRTGDIGGFFVNRALPSRQKRMIGPFIFWDEMGPGEFLEGKGLDVRPHPHIGLSTVTYLFKGTMDHKDSLGTSMTIQPGDVNLMTAGRGIVHSERSGPEARASHSSLFGIQSWLALPQALEETAPSFRHYDKVELPESSAEGVDIRLIMGEAFGMKSPVHMDWETLYADVRMITGGQLSVSKKTEERALFIVSGAIEIEGQAYEPLQMISLKPGVDVIVKATSDTHMMVLGGAAMDGPRYIWWNFSSSSLERLRVAAKDWQDGKFEKVPGDEDEFIPLPDIKELDRLKA